GDISSTFASTYKIETPLPTPFTINYLFDGNAHVYLPDAIGQLQDGSLLIAEAGMEQEKRKERNQAKAEAARKVASTRGLKSFHSLSDQCLSLVGPFEWLSHGLIVIV